MGGSQVDCRREEPVLTFAQYAVAFHLAVADEELSGTEGGGSSGHPPPSLEERALESYERDMLLYAYRHVAPLRTEPIAVPSQASVAVVFPPELVFESEGNPIRLRCSGAEEDGRVRSATLSVSRTRFYSQVDVVTLVLGPRSPTDPLSEINEYDAIKLAKLWEGGERLPEPGSPDEEAGPTRFALEGDELGLQQLARSRVSGPWRFLDYHGEQLASAMHSPAAESQPASPDQGLLRHYRVGTIALKLPATRENRRLLADAQAVKDLSDRLPGSGTRRWKRVVALGGLIQGLLDFVEIGPAELSDVFAEAELDEESLLAFHKGTLLSVSIEGSSEEEQREAELARPIGMSPYLVIPHAVLLHNEQRLKSALIDANELLSGQERRGRPIEFRGRRISFGGGRISIEDTEVGIREVSEALAQRLPNVFHYQSERSLYERGTASRGFDDFDPLIRLRLGELQGRLESRVRLRDTWTLGLTITFFAIAALQLALTSVQWWASLLVLAVLALIVWQLRRRLF